MCVCTYLNNFCMCTMFVECSCRPDVGIGTAEMGVT